MQGINMLLSKDLDEALGFVDCSRSSCFRLDLLTVEAVLPEGSIGGDTIFTEVNEDVPTSVSKCCLSSEHA